MPKDPRFNFYPDNYEGGTDFFTLEQDGAYIRLFILQFRYGQFTEKQAIQKIMSRCADTPHRAAELWESLKHKYETDGVNFWNARLRSEIDKSKKQSEDQADRANKRWGNNSGNAAAYAGEVPEVAIPMADAFSSNSISITKSNTSTKKNKAIAPEKPFDFLAIIPNSWDAVHFEKLVAGWVYARRKKPPTEYAKELAITDLVQYFPNWTDAKSRMEQAIKGGWLDLVFKEDKVGREETKGRYANERGLKFDKA